MNFRRSAVASFLLTAATVALVAWAPSASASTEFGRTCAPGPSGNVCAAIVFEVFGSRTQIKTRIGAESTGPVITVVQARTVKIITVNGTRSQVFADTEVPGSSVTTTGPHVNLWSQGFDEECDLPGRVITYSAHGEYTVNGVRYGIDMAVPWGGRC